MHWREARQAWKEVPQATMMMRRPRLMEARWSASPPSVMRRSLYGSTACISRRRRE
jgi:hypothetical protein